jgi:hypothetical protein
MNTTRAMLSKSCFLLLIFSLLNGCLSGTRPPVSLSPRLDKRIYKTTQLPIKIGIYIEPSLRNYVQEEWLRHYNIGIHRLVFPIGEHLSSRLEEMSRIIFREVVFINDLEDKERLNRESMEGILVFALKKSEIELNIEESILWAIGKHTLSITATFLDAGYQKQWGIDVTAEGKGLDVVTSRIEYEWWVTSAPNFAPAVDEAIEKITYELSQRLIAKLANVGMEQIGK